MINALLFCGLLYQKRDYRNRAVSELIDKFGDISDFSKTMDFAKYSSYYDDEMGSGITREWILFADEIDLEHLFEKKVTSVSIEEKFKIGGKRNINIDPGVITLSNVQLLTTKNFAHRVYLGEGIFCEVTFTFTKNKNGVKYLEWTYPDYKSEEASEFFLRNRNILKKQ